MEKDTKCHITDDTIYTMTDKEPKKKKRGRGYTKALCKKAKAKRKR